MDSAQTWAMIGVFTSVVLGGMTLMTTLIMRANAGAITGLRGEMSGLDAKITGLGGEMNARFDAMDVKITHLDRDVNLLMHRAWNDRDTG